MNSWNRNNPRFRRTRTTGVSKKSKPTRGRSQKNLLSRVGTKISGLLRGLTGKAAPAPVKTLPNRPQPAAPPEDSFDDLKIAVPKNRKYPNTCAPRPKPRPEAEIEAGRKKVVTEVMEAIAASPGPDGPAYECEELVDLQELAETFEEFVESPEPTETVESFVEPLEAEKASAPVLDDAELDALLSAEATIEAARIEHHRHQDETRLLWDEEKSAYQPEPAPVSPETDDFENLPKIAVLTPSTQASRARARRRLPDRRTRTAPPADEDAAAAPQLEPDTAVQDEAVIDAADHEPPVSTQAASEADTIENDGKKPTSWSRLADNSKAETPRRSGRVFGLIAVLVLVGAGLGLGYLYFPGQRTPVPKVARIPAANLPKIEPLSPGFYELWAKEREATTRSETTISPGSTLGKALEAVGIGTRHGASAIIESLTTGEGGLGNKVMPGAVVKSYWTDRGRTELDRLEYYPASGAAPLVVRPTPDGGFMRYSLSTLPLTVNMAREGAITSSLWEAGDKAGLDSSVIMTITEILASEVDFFTDIQAGDTFQVLYNRDYSDGRPAGAPDIEMIKLVNKGRVLEYYRFVNSDGQVGYYDPSGRSNVKTFFVTPLQYKRISSQFSMARKHPIFKTVRPHQGVDYAAPNGTPVSSVADGTVIYCDWSGGYGKLVTIKHDETYTTMYAHLSRFAPDLKKGSVVRQGDLIGYVGATGTATGPHLDFRLKKNNVFIDPLPELAKQQGKKIENKDDLQAFASVVGLIRERMRQQMAANVPDGD